MLGVDPPKPSFLRAFSMCLIMSVPLVWLVWYVLRWHSAWVFGLWIVLALLGAPMILGRMANDWRAKGTMHVMRDRYRR
jgi:hypothetical protein